VLFRADAGRPKIQCSRHLDLLHHVRAVCPHSSGSQKRAVANQIILLIKDQFNSLDAPFEARRLLSLQPKQRVGQRSKLPQPADAQALANQLSMMKQAQTYLAAQLTSSLGTSHLLLRIILVESSQCTRVTASWARDHGSLCCIVGYVTSRSESAHIK